MKKLLFTGASGFLGYNIRPILEKSYDVHTIGLTDDDDIKINMAKEVPPINTHYDVVLHAAGKAHVVPKTEEEKEYERSVGTADVSVDTFTKDKAEIRRIIQELDVVMQEYNYKAWLTYLDADSISYWSKKANLTAAQKKLPIKGLQLRTLEDYFKYVFVPSRKGKEIKEELRYISDKNLQAVQVQEDEAVIVYYNFNKIDDAWKLHIPENEQ